MILDAAGGVFKIGRRPPYSTLYSYSMPVQLNRAYRVKIVANAGVIEAYLDGVKRLSAMDATYGSRRFGVILFESVASWDDLEAWELR